MGPSLNLFSRRKNSNDRITPKSPESLGSSHSPSSSTQSNDSSSIAPIAVGKQYKSHSKERSPASPTRQASLPKIRTQLASTTSQDHAPIHLLARSGSDISIGCRRDGSSAEFRGNRPYSSHPPPPPPPPGRQILYQPSPVRTQRFQHHHQLSSDASMLGLPTPGSSAPPTPVAGALMTPTSAPISAFDQARKRVFRFPANNLPISPPLSPETPMAQGYSPMDFNGLQSMGMSPIFPMRSFPTTPNLDSPESASHDALLQRIRELDLKNRELEEEAAQHSARITALRASHAAAVDSLKEAHAAEFDSLQKTTLWPSELGGKEKELELLRANNDSVNARMGLLESLLKERDHELDYVKEKMRRLEWERKAEEKEVAAIEVTDIGRRLAEEIRRRKAAEASLKQAGQKDYEQLLADERRQLEFVVQEEEKRRAELNWLHGERIEKAEMLRQSERQEFEQHLGKMHQERETAERKVHELTEELERRKNSGSTGGEELVAMVQKINTRLAEEKKKNKQLEASMAQITEEAWLNVSDSKHDIQKLKNAIEDKDALIARLDREITIIKRERDEFKGAWQTVQRENEVLEQTVKDRDERIKELKEGSGALRDTLEQTPGELLEQRQQSDVHRGIPVKPAESSCNSSRASSREGLDSAEEAGADLKEVVDKLRRDIKLYRSDIRAYKHDLRVRNKAIVQLQSQLSSPIGDLPVFKGFPTPPSSDGQRDENEMLREQLSNHEALSKQQALVLEEVETKMREVSKEKEQLKKEKEQLEVEALRQLRKMQQGYARLEQQQSGGSGGKVEVEYRQLAVGMPRLRKIPGGQKRKDVNGEDAGPESAPQTSPLPRASPLPPPLPPKKTLGTKDEGGEVFVW